MVADAKARGLSMDAVDGGVFTALSMASVVPATVIGLTIDLRTADAGARCASRILASGGGEDDDDRYYVAVDDGTSDRIRAWRIDEALYGRLEQGEFITARLSRNLCCVRWIISAEGAGAAG